MDKNMKVLVVDDFPTMRRIIKNLLRELGVNNTLEAEDGDIAFEMLKKEPFDFVITDWNMPKVSGLDLLKQIRQDEKLNSIPVLMVTAEGTKQQVLDAAAAGINSYIIKPFTSDILKNKIDLIFSRITDAGQT